MILMDYNLQSYNKYETVLNVYDSSLSPLCTDVIKRILSFYIEKFKINT